MNVRSWRQRLAILVALASVCAVAVGPKALGQTYGLPVYKAFTVTTGSPSFVLNGLSGQSNCAVTIATGATFGGGTISFYTAADGGTAYTLTTGIPDLGNPTSGGSQTTSSAPSKYTVPVAGQTSLKIVLAGSSGASVSGAINCNAGVARIGGGGGGATPTPLPSSLTFSKLVCSGGVLCSPSAGPTPAVSYTQGPSYSSLTLPSLANVSCMGTNSSGLLVSSVCPSPGPINGSTCISAINTPSPATISYTCATPYPTPAATATTCASVATAAGPPVTFTVGFTCATPGPTPAAVAPITTSTPGGILTFGCATCVTSTPAPTRAKLAIALGANQGVVSLTYLYPVQQVVGYTSGSITALRATCSTTGSSTTTLTATDVTSNAKIGTVSLSSSSLTAVTTLGSPYSLTAGHVLTMSATAAGGHGNCSLVAEGQQQTY